MTKILAATLVVATVTVAAIAWTSQPAHAEEWKTTITMAWDNTSQGHWTPPGEPAGVGHMRTPQSPSAQDYNGDGVVDGSDFVVWQGGHGQ